MIPSSKVVKLGNGQIGLKIPKLDLTKLNIDQ